MDAVCRRWVNSPVQTERSNEEPSSDILSTQPHCRTCLCGVKHEVDAPAPQTTSFASEGLLQRLENQLEWLLIAISKLRVQHNLSLLATSLPAEILSHIFGFWYYDEVWPYWRDRSIISEVGDEFEDLHYNIPMYPPVAQVCSSWRQAALDTPCLWNTLNPDQPQLAMAVLDRSNFPVRVQCHARPRGSPHLKAFMSRLSSYYSCVTEIDIDYRPRTICAFVEATNRPLMSLKSLSLTWCCDFEYEECPIEEFKKLEAPVLEMLHLRRVPIPWTFPVLRSGTLRSLQIYYDTLTEVSLNDILDALDHLRSLESLELREIDIVDKSTFAAPSTDCRKVFMPHLSIVTITGTTSGCAIFLCHMNSGQLWCLLLRVECLYGAAEGSADLLHAVETLYGQFWPSQPQMITEISDDTIGISRASYLMDGNNNTCNVDIKFSGDVSAVFRAFSPETMRLTSRLTMKLLDVYNGDAYLTAAIARSRIVTELRLFGGHSTGFFFYMLGVHVHTEADILPSLTSLHFVEIPYTTWIAQFRLLVSYLTGQHRRILRHVKSLHFEQCTGISNDHLTYLRTGFSEVTYTEPACPQ
jgi:hypothetical protein